MKQPSEESSTKQDEPSINASPEKKTRKRRLGTTNFVIQPSIKHENEDSVTEPEKPTTLSSEPKTTSLSITKSILSRRSLPRSSRPTKIKELPSDDDLDESIEMDSIEYTKSLVRKRMGKSTLLETLKQNSTKPEIDADSDSNSFQANDDDYSHDDALPMENSDTEPPAPKPKRAKRAKAKVTAEVPAGGNKKQRKPRNSQTPIQGVDSPALRSIRSLIGQRDEQRHLPTPKSSPVPLSKKRSTEVQKPLYVDVHRLTTDENRDKRTRIHTLDVIRQLVQNFEPSASTKKEAKLNEDFRLYLQNYLDYLMDLHASINDISHKILQVQAQKNDLRSEIYDIKSHHVEVGNSLNEVRRSYSNERESFERFDTVYKELQKLKDNPKTENQAHIVSNGLSQMSAIVNPKSGLYSKLKIVNEKLERIDKELHNSIEE